MFREQEGLAMSLRRIGIVCTLVSLLIIVSSVNAQGRNPPDAVVVDTRGFPEVKFGTETSFVRLVKGTRLGVGDMIETGDKGKVEFMLSDGSMIVIGANSRVVIKELNMLEVTKISTSTFELLIGKIRAIVVPFVSNDSRFTIETGNATVGVRGTDFGVTRDPDAGTTHLLTVKGAVYLTLTYFPDLPPIFVVGGEEITVTGDTLPPMPSRASGETTYQFLQKMMVFPPGGRRGVEGGDKSDERGGSQTSIKH
jgi:hypothetical protein